MKTYFKPQKYPSFFLSEPNYFLQSALEHPVFMTPECRINIINFVPTFLQVLSELIETEQKYVKDLQFLLAAYLEPLRKERFWNYSDLEQLYNNVKEIFVFQTKFLRILEESLESDPGFGSHSTLAQFKVCIVSEI